MSQMGVASQNLKLDASKKLALLSSQMLLSQAKLHESFSVITREQVAQIHNTLFQPDLQGRSRQDLQSQQQCACPAWVPLPGCYGPWRSDNDDAQEFI